MARKLYRSDTDRMIAGVCGGMGEYLDVDPTLIRLAFVLAVLAGFGSGVLLYIILMFIVPLQGQVVTVNAPAPAPVNTAENAQ